MFTSEPYDQERDNRLDDWHGETWTDADTDAYEKYRLEGAESPPNGEEA